ncbi:hypothetical protein FRC08_004981 [Ceratobasidium sp. 394]|nr:hypothetical protein FRC08_004981 [Ceratobasidium sp. 394]
MPARGEGPPRETLEEGRFELTNVAEAGGIVAKSVVKGDGDPAYYLAAWMVAERAILLLDESNLTALGQQEAFSLGQPHLEIGSLRRSRRLESLRRVWRCWCRKGRGKCVERRVLRSLDAGATSMGVGYAGLSDWWLWRMVVGGRARNGGREALWGV